MIRTNRLLNHYQTLGVGFRATQSEVKASFRELAKKYHPDRNSNDTQAESRFRAIKEAYECLSSKTRRAEYDREWVRTGKVSWDPAPLETQGTESEPNSGILSRKDLMIFYALIIGLPGVSAMVRWKESTPERARGERTTESMWATPKNLPEVFGSDTIVPAFFNPFNGRWEKLSPGESPPTPIELLQFVVRDQRGLYQSKVQSGKLSMPSKDDRFEIVNVPDRVTYPPMYTAASIQTLVS